MPLVVAAGLLLDPVGELTTTHASADSAASRAASRSRVLRLISVACCFGGEATAASSLCVCR